MSRDRVRLGFVPLTDAAPLIVAAEIGFAAEEGLKLDLIRAASWAQLRDLVGTGAAEAAHMLAPMPVARAMGLGPALAALSTLMVLSLGGQAIGVSQPVARRMRDAGYGFDFADPWLAGRALQAATGDAVLRIGVPFPFSTHALLVRHWLSAIGFDPRKIDICTVPPPLVAAALAAQEIDAFCVGEPWGTMAVDAGAGSLVLPGRAIWATAPEKVLAARTHWVDANPDTTGQLMRAVWRAGRWLDRQENRGTAAELLARPEYLDLPVEILEPALTGDMTVTPGGETRRRADFIAFHDGAASFPWRSLGALFGQSIAQVQGSDITTAMAAGAGVFRSDVYRLHLASAGADMPGASAKLEGGLEHPTAVASDRGRMILGPDRFFDGWTFEPASSTR